MCTRIREYHYHPTLDIFILNQYRQATVVHRGRGPFKVLHSEGCPVAVLSDTPDLSRRNSKNTQADALNRSSARAPFAKVRSHYRGTNGSVAVDEEKILHDCNSDKNVRSAPHVRCERRRRYIEVEHCSDDLSQREHRVE
ncbi:hypothetical protein EVAR_8424_1 [Eumeta japonica]|uniref:Uncharacterized protein n=1 Tax=Eumeta variegata TaxID=151549 RepID=A0A4C1WBQ3_EUMVA|nr:hypothetical protein EVAR_8424_1 [Eumeta japonica]